MDNAKNVVLAKGTMNFYAYCDPYDFQHISIRTQVTSRDDLLEMGLSKHFIGRLNLLEKEYLLESIKSSYTFEVHNLYLGKTFASHVEQSVITNNDGIMSEVFVDGFVSNLGLLTQSFCQGQFLVDMETWQRLCNEHDIQVNWVNK